MFIEKLENRNQFEIGKNYYYHFSCNYDTLAYMQIVSISDTRKTAVIQEICGGRPDGKPKRKKIYIYNGVEHIAAGNYSMAGIWSADMYDKTDLKNNLDINFMYESEMKADLQAVFFELPEEINAESVYTINVDICTKNLDAVYSFHGVNLAAITSFLNSKAAEIYNAVGLFCCGYELFENGVMIDAGCTIVGKTENDATNIIENIEIYVDPDKYAEILATIASEIFPAEVMEALAEIADDISNEAEAINRTKIEMTCNSNPDPDGPNSGKNDSAENESYSDYDENFNACSIISVTFGGDVSGAAEVPNRRPLTESEWRKLLEQKEIFENAARRERMQEIASQLVTAFENAHGDGVPLADGVTGYELLNVDDDGKIFDDLDCWAVDVGGLWHLDIYSFIDGDFDVYTGKTTFYEIPQNIIESAEPDPAQITFDDISVCEAEATEETVNSSNEFESVQPVEASAATGENDNDIITITESEWENICPDYKGTWQDYHGNHPEWLGNRVVMSGCINSNPAELGKLLIEGVHFVIKNTRKSVQNLHLRV